MDTDGPLPGSRRTESAPMSPDDAVLATAAAVLARAEARRLRGSARAARALHRELATHPRIQLAPTWATIEQAKGMVLTTDLHHESGALGTLFDAARAGRRSIIDVATALVEKVTAGEAVTSALASVGHGGEAAGRRTTPGSGTAAAEAVARATAFIDANAARNIGKAEIIAAAGLGERGLQQAFRVQLDTTPNAYLRRARLAGAHHDLLLADPGRQTVAAIARRWRFSHQGRFAEFYRRTYGHSPGRSLRRSPSALRD